MLYQDTERAAYCPCGTYRFTLAAPKAIVLFHYDGYTAMNLQNVAGTHAHTESTTGAFFRVYLGHVEDPHHLHLLEAVYHTCPIGSVIFVS
jgi:hypothetical protein